jgi:protein-S-isoprenylcysteine O-methyltransferase Ste14
MITIILFLFFILILILQWILFFKIRNKKLLIKLKQQFAIIRSLILIIIPILNSSLLRFYFSENLSYFKDYWNLFALLGIVFIILGINIAKRGYQLKKRQKAEKKSNLITSGVYRIIRHPKYSAWVILFIGMALISDSIISLILCPIILISFEIHAFFEEKLIFFPRYGTHYTNFIEKTPYRIIPTPLNFFLIIITMFIVYIGFLNIS